MLCKVLSLSQGSGNVTDTVTVNDSDIVTKTADGESLVRKYCLWGKQNPIFSISKMDYGKR